MQLKALIAAAVALCFLASPPASEVVFQAVEVEERAAESEIESESEASAVAGTLLVSAPSVRRHACSAERAQPSETRAVRAHGLRAPPA